MSKIELIQGDCLERMKEIPDGSIDLVLTDPPYGTSRLGSKIHKWCTDANNGKIKSFKTTGEDGT